MPILQAHHPGELVSLMQGAIDAPWLRSGALLVARFLPIAVLTPLFGGPLAPRRFRLAGSLLLAIAFLPAAVLAGEPPSHAPYVILVGKELLIGLTIALAIRFLFEVYSALGRLVDDARGATIAELSDPSNNPQPSQLGAFLVVAAVAAFLVAGGHAIVLDAVAESLVAVPLFALLPSASIGPGAAPALIALTSMLLLVAVKLAAPVLVLMLAIDLVMGILNRLAPQFQANLLGLMMKSAAALAILSFSLALVFTSPMRGYLAAITAWVRSLAA